MNECDERVLIAFRLDVSGYLSSEKMPLIPFNWGAAGAYDAYDVVNLI